MLCTSQFQNRPSPPPRAIPGHLTRLKLRTVGNLTQNEARPVGHLTFVTKRLLAVGNKRISQFFDSPRESRSRVIALVDSKWVFLLLSVQGRPTTVFYRMLLDAVLGYLEYFQSFVG